MQVNTHPTHFRATHVNPINLTPFFKSNNLLVASNPNISYSAANRTFGGTSSSSYSAQTFGVKGSSRALSSATYLNKAYLQFPQPQRALAELRKLKNTTFNNSFSTTRNGYFHRNVAYGELLNSNVAGPKK